MLFEVRHLRIVDAVAREGNLTGAARQLHLTQPAISHALRDLRERLGFDPFRREGRQLVPTAEGERILQSAQVVLDELRQAERDLEELRDGRGGQLRLATECYTCYHWLPSLLERYRRDYPTVDVSIVPDATADPMDALLADRLDLAIMRHRTTRPDVATTLLFSDELVTVVAPSHPFAERDYVEAEDFADERVYLHTEAPDSAFFGSVLAPARVKPKELAAIQLTEAVIQIVKARMGVAVMARWAVTPHLESGNLRAVRITRAGLHRKWYAAVRRTTASKPHVRAMIKLLKEDALCACHAAPM